MFWKISNHMKKYFEKLRQRPEAQRKKTASIFAGIVTILIVVLWILILTLVKSDFKKTSSGFEQFDELIKGISEKSTQLDKVMKEQEEVSTCVSKTLDSLKQEESEEVQNDERTPIKSQEECATNDVQATQTNKSKHQETLQADE